MQQSTETMASELNCNPERPPNSGGEGTESVVSSDQESKQKIKLEAYLTAGCGYGRMKQQLLETFWRVVWGGLEEIGWTKVEGTGKNEGSIQFFPPGVTKQNGRRGKDYYDRVKDVINRIQERKNDEESKVADKFLASKVMQEKQAQAQVQTDRPRRAKPASELSPVSANKTGGKIVDLSWKEGGSSFPKRASRVGQEYQVDIFPKAGSYIDNEDGNSDAYCDQIWDPTIAEAKGVLGFVADHVPHNKKEALLAALHNKDYELSNIHETLNKIDVVDGSDWTPAEKKKFHDEIFRVRKDMKEMSTIMNKPMKSCLAYYLGTYKKSNDYRLLKTICVEERLKLQTSMLHDYDACAVCGDGGNLLICDGCEGEYHMSCLQPPLRSVPEGNWECDECVDRKLLLAREYVITNSSLYSQVDESSKKRTSSDISSNDEESDDKSSSSKVAKYRPSPDIIPLAESFASKISHILTCTDEKITLPANSPYT